MARAIWTGSVAFGLVNVPVALFSRDRGQDDPLQPVPGRHLGPDPLQASQRAHRPEVRLDDIVKGHDVGQG